MSGRLPRRLHAHSAAQLLIRRLASLSPGGGEVARRWFYLPLVLSLLLVGFVQPRSDVGHQPLENHTTLTRVAPVDSQLRPTATGRAVLWANDRPFFPVGVTYHFTRQQGEWDADLKLMQDMGLNTVRADFAWRDIVPTWEGRYNFAVLDQFLDKAAQYGLYVVPVFSYATGDINTPWWFWLFYRGWGAVGADGWRPFGDWPSMNSADYRRLFSEYVSQTVRHLSQHPAVLAYQVMNEPHYPPEPLSDYSDAALKAFRQWARDNHQSLQDLNGSWDSDYRSFADIVPPQLTSQGADWSTLLWQDWRKFAYESVASFVGYIATVVRQADGQKHAILVSEMTWWWWGEEPATAVSPEYVYDAADVVGFDVYPESGAHADYYGLNVDLLQRIWQKPVWAMEVNRKDGNPTAGEIRAFVASAVERGATGIFYFEWRDTWSDGGAYGLLDTRGNPKPQFYAFADTVDWLRRQADRLVSGQVSPPDAYVVWSSEAIAITAGDKSPAHDVFQTASKLLRRGLRVGILPEAQALAVGLNPTAGVFYGQAGAR